VGQELNPVSAVSHITVVIPASGRRISLQLDDEIQVGRRDPAHNHFPALDLTEDQGSLLGVSRVHALIQASLEGVVLVDQGSANGTYLNGYQLPPQLPYLLHSGDEVRFGQLLVHFFLE
jgi:pSer/pThr/pTyr-binding forkhead associated (FHA) protein